jgi:hypothetical protein
VEQAIFKISKYQLSRHSPVFDDMISIVGDKSEETGTDQNPLFLAGDTVAGWELFLSILFPEYNFHIRSHRRLSNISQSTPTRPVDIYVDPKLGKLLLLAHKYSMETIEKDIIGQLEKSKSVLDPTDLMVISQTIDSPSLYEKAKELLIKREENLTLDNAERIGLSSTYDILMARSKRPPRCPHCHPSRPALTFQIVCTDCGNYYTYKGVP